MFQREEFGTHVKIMAITDSVSTIKFSYRGKKY